MATAAQVEANRSNAQKSTGPRTPEGKETAAQNALKHGLFAREGVIRGEDEEEFEEHRERLLGQLNPVGPLEEILADRIVDLSWRLKRAVQDQSEAFAALYEKYAAPQAAGPEAGSASGTGILPVDPNHGQDAHATAATLGRMILEDFSQNTVLERLLRHERRIESSLYRTLNQLRRVHDQCQKADLEDASTLERWREEDWDARKARTFAFGPAGEVSPGPAEGTTNVPTAEVPHPGDGPSWQDAGPAPDGPPGDETGQTNPIGEEVSSVKCQVSSESCKTNPISEEASSFMCQVSSEPSRGTEDESREDQADSVKQSELEPDRIGANLPGGTLSAAIS